MKGHLLHEIVKCSQPYIVGAAYAEFFKCFQNAERHDSIADEDCGWPFDAQKQLFCQTVARLLTKVPFEDQTVLDFAICFSQSLLVPLQTLFSRLELQISGNDGDIFIASLNHVPEAFEAAACIVKQHCVCLH